MSVNLENYDALIQQQGLTSAKTVTLTGTVNLASSTLTLPANTATGANTTQKATYGTSSVNTNGTTAVNLFATGSTAPTAGTITGVGITFNDTTKGTIDLISDQGTLVRMVKTGTAGNWVGSFITPIAYQSGSKLQVISAGSDNANFEATFYTYA